MLLIPIGLGKKPPRLPFMLIIIVLLNVIGFYEFSYSKYKVSFSNALKNSSKFYEMEKGLYFSKFKDCKSKPRSKTCIRRREIFESYIYENKDLLLLKDKEDLYKKQASLYYVALTGLSSKYDEIEKFQEISILFRKIFDENAIKTNSLSVRNINFKTILISMFSHINLGHIVSNLFAFILFGIYIESRMGSILFTTTYLLTGFGAGILSLLTELGPVGVWLGASGAVYGVMGMFLVSHMKERFYFLMWSPKKKYTMHYSAYWMIILMFVVNEYFSLGNTDGVAHVAHLSGFFLGAFFATIVNFFKKIPSGFLSKASYKNYKEVGKGKKSARELSTIKKMTTEAPYDHNLKTKLVLKLYKSIAIRKKLSSNELKLIQKLSKQVLPILVKEKRYKEAVAVLNCFPFTMNIKDIIKRIPMNELQNVSDFAMEKKNYLMAIKLYDYLLMSKYKNPNILKTIQSILTSFTSDYWQGKKLDSYIQNNPTSFIELPTDEAAEEKVAA